MKNLFSVLLLLVYKVTLCQVNLVPNSGFDTITSCPSNGAQIYKAFPWIDPTGATSDLINTCGVGNYCQAPNNEYAWQMPFNGQGYVGIACYVDSACCSNTREYIQVRLLKPLESGKKYCVSYYISWGDSSKYACDCIGAYFSNTPISCNSCLLQFIPQVQNYQGNIINDGIGWQKISGFFVAQGSEEYITIGCFNTDQQISIQTVNPNAFYIVAYYLIDQVSVFPVNEIFNNYSDTVCAGDSLLLGLPSMSDVTYSWQPSTGLSSSNIAQPKASPNVTTIYTLTQTQCDVVQTSEITVIVKTNCPDSVPQFPTILVGDELLYSKDLLEGTTLQIFDALGKAVYYSTNYQNDFCACLLAQGTYILRLKLPSGRLVQRKLVVVR